MTYIYIAYEPVDYALATHVKATLEGEGYTSWFDETRLDPSAHPTQPRIEDVIYSSISVIGIVPQSGTTPLLMNETGYARSLGKTVFWVQSASDMDAVIAGLQRTVLGEGTNSIALPQPFDYNRLEMQEAANTPPRELFILGGVVTTALMLLALYGLVIAPFAVTPPSAFTATAESRLLILTLSAIPTEIGIAATPTPFRLPTLPPQNTSIALAPPPTSTIDALRASATVIPLVAPLSPSTIAPSATPTSLPTTTLTAVPITPLAATLSNTERTLTALAIMLTQVAVETNANVSAGGSEATEIAPPSTATPSLTSTLAPTLTATTAPSLTLTLAPTSTLIPSFTPTIMLTATLAPTLTALPSLTSTPTFTVTPPPPTLTLTTTAPPTFTLTATATSTTPPTSTWTPSPLPTLTFTPSPLPTLTATQTASPFPTFTPTLTPTLEPTADTSQLPAGYDNRQWTPNVGVYQDISLVFVPAGCYVTSSADASAEPQEICVPDFWIGQYEITNGQYAACVNAGVCSPPNSFSSSTRASYYGDAIFSNYPVINITWNQAAVYAEWIGGRLPTEHEWRYAAHGPASFLYPWGDDEPNASLLNFNDLLQDATEVGRFPQGASWVGALDLAGNIWEWTAPGPNSTAAQLPDDAVIAGGSWNSFGSLVQANYAAPKPKDESDVYTGVRIAFDPSIFSGE